MFVVDNCKLSFKLLKQSKIGSVWTLKIFHKVDCFFINFCHLKVKVLKVWQTIFLDWSAHGIVDPRYNTVDTSVPGFWSYEDSQLAIRVPRAHNIDTVSRNTSLLALLGKFTKFTYQYENIRFEGRKIILKTFLISRYA